MSHLSRRSVLALALLGGVAAAAGGCGADAASGASDAAWTLRIGTIGSRNRLTGPVGWLHAQNKLLPLLAAAHVEKIEVYTFPNGPDLNQALVGGKLDLASYGDTPALVARGAGQPTRLIAESLVGNDAGIVTVPGGVSSLRDLNDKVIATQTGSYIHRYLLGALADLGVKPRRIVHVYSTDTEAALAKRSVDAAAVPANYAYAFQAKGYPLLELASKARPRYLGTSATVVTETTRRRHAPLIRAWQQAQTEATRQAKAGWPDYLAFNVDLGPFGADIVRRSVLREQLPDTPFTDAGLTLLKGTKDFLVGQKLVAKDFSVDDWIAPEARQP
ncbi:ABC transporter substrate-binding protein [Plantactinospora siamensis]|uniref:ABC transporter substrate-binding protein n=1 Tax=Plantactinospora siamensis TaxID=555372 RepID=A0ABV6NS31_9ACTN